MELRSRTRLQLRRAAMTAALGALLVPATAGAATKPPVITKVAPKSVSVGETLTVYGRNFRPGKGTNTVLFKRDGGKSLFVKAGLSTRKQLKVAVPKVLEAYMAVKAGTPAASRFRLRVLTTKLSKSYTPTAKSPTIGPEKVKPGAGGGGAGGGTTALDPNADCDGDGLTNSFETGVTKTQACVADTDADGVPDGYEYRSAVDLNSDDYRHPVQSLPYPGKRPYPNPLDGSDANIDFDGDSLYLSEEYALWQYTISQGADRSLDNLTYSDGLKYSIHTTDGLGRHPALATAGYDKAAAFASWLAVTGYGTVQWPGSTTPESIFDFDRSGTVDSDPLRSAPGQVFRSGEDAWLDTHGPVFASTPDGWLSDDERDEDADGLSNYVETHGPLLRSYWTDVYDKEKPYPIAYAGVSPIDADSDGDGVRDGADDQDHDDLPNIMEVSRLSATGRTGAVSPNPYYGRVNPYNPCLPYTGSRTCPSYVPSANAWAPFDTSPNYEIFN